MGRKLEPQDDVASVLVPIERLARDLGGIPVLEVLQGSSAQHAGVRFGDIILSVNGVATPTFQDFLAAGRVHLMHLEFEVFRDGRRLVLYYDEPIDA